VTFSTSTSTAPSLLATSFMTFFAPSFSSWSLRMRMKGASFFCASLTFSCSAVYSVRATFLASGANCFAAVIFCASLMRAVLMDSDALATAFSVSLMVASADSLILSEVSMDSGLAVVTTMSSMSSAVVTTSMASGSASSSSLASRCSFFICCSSARARCFCSSASCFFFTKSCFACLTCCARLCCTVRTRAVRPFKATTVFGAERRASMMSAATFFCWSSMAVCCACSSSSTIFRLSSLTSPSIMARALSRAWLASISATMMRSVARSTRSSVSTAEASAASTCAERSTTLDASAALAAPAGLAASAALALALAGAGVVGAIGCAFLGSKTKSGCTFPSHGTRQPVVGGSWSVFSHRDQTCAPPTLSPNHQPPKSAPSRWSQK